MVSETAMDAAAREEPIPTTALPDHPSSARNDENGISQRNAATGTVPFGASIKGNGPQVRVETRAFAHKYWIRRPRALQYFDHGSYINSAHPVTSDEPENTTIWARQRMDSVMIPLPKHSEFRSTDVPIAQRRRLDLFIDLLWVGIISNISERFSVTAFSLQFNYGLAFLEFLILFLTAWQIWNYLRQYLNNYYVDDMSQRIFVVWILILALVFGNNAPFLLPDLSGIVLGLFLLARASFSIMEAVYSYFIPGLRKQFVANLIFALPVMGLFIGAIFVSWPAKGGLILAAIFLDVSQAAMMNSSIGDRLVHEQFKKAPDPDHFVDRLEGFFIIILGEGVFLLIKGSPLGAGLSGQPGTGILILMVYYYLFSMYFNGDQTRNFIHASRNSWWTAELFLLFHVVMYGSLLLLGAGLLTLLQKSFDTSGATASGASAETIQEENAYAVRSAKWTSAVALSIAMLCMTLMSLLNRPLDRPGTLVVNSRYIRVAPRLALVAIAPCLAIKSDFSVVGFIAIIAGLLFAVVIFEWAAGMETGGKFMEPKEAKEK